MPLSTLLYASTARPDLSRTDIDAIVVTAKRANSELGITGVLAFDGKGFAQILEGEGDTIRTLYQKIERDPRHSGCVLLAFSEIPQRRFNDWSMGYRPLSDLILIQDTIL
jgi:hypothetical protein